MLELQARVLHVYESPKGTNKEGREFGGEARVQMIQEQYLRNGETKQDLVDLRVDDPSPFRSAVGRMVRIPVGVFATNSRAVFYHARSAPVPLTVLDETDPASLLGE